MTENVVQDSSRPLILAIGCGNMGSALLTPSLRDGVADVAVVDPMAKPDILSHVAGVGNVTHVCASMGEYFERHGGAHDYALFGVKPQDLGVTLDTYKTLADNALGAPKPAFSMAAGASVAFFRKRLGEAAEVVRSMPNMACRTGKGAGAVFMSEGISAKTADFARRFFTPAGCEQEVEQETLLDSVTGVSGSGPAYFFLLSEALEEAGVAMGLTREAAATLALRTLAGAGALAAEAESQGLGAQDLRRQITSKGGTTAAALAVFMEDEALGKLAKKAAGAARARAGELSLP